MKTPTIAALISSLVLSIITGCASFEETLALADRGDASAQYRVAQAYAKGEEVPRDPEKAELYYAKAVAGGESRAKRALLLHWMERGAVSHREEIIAGYPNVAESGFINPFDTDLLDRAPDFAKAMVESEDFTGIEQFEKMVTDVEMELFKERRLNGGGPRPGFWDQGGLHDQFWQSEEIRSFMIRIALVNKVLDEKRRAIADQEARKAQQAAEERRLAEERARKEAEERKAAERAAAEKARKEAEERWLARKDDPAYAFPLRNAFPNSVPVYKDLRTGCSLEWAREYIHHGGFATTNRARSFLGTVSGMKSFQTEGRAIPKDIPYKAETEASVFIDNPINLTFFDEGRVVTLTFGATGLDGDKRILVGGEIVFPDRDIAEEALVEKYRNQLAQDNPALDRQEESVTGGGGSLGVLAIPEITIKTRFSTLSTDAARISVATEVSASVKWDTPIGQTIRIDEAGKANWGDGDMELGLLVAPQMSGEFHGKALAMWAKASEDCGKPVVSIVDRRIFIAAAKVKDGKTQQEEERRRQKEEAAERAKNEQLRRKMESF